MATSIVSSEISATVLGGAVPFLPGEADLEEKVLKRAQKTLRKAHTRDSLGALTKFAEASAPATPSITPSLTHYALRRPEPTRLRQLRQAIADGRIQAVTGI